MYAHIRFNTATTPAIVNVANIKLSDNGTVMFYSDTRDVDGFYRTGDNDEWSRPLTFDLLRTAIQVTANIQSAFDSFTIKFRENINDAYQEQTFNVSGVVGAAQYLISDLFPLVLSAAQIAIIAAFTAEQQAVIATLPVAQQIVLATATLITAPTPEQTAIIVTLLPEQQLLFAAPVVVVTAYTQTPEQIAADKLTIEQITFKLKNNEYITDNESVLLVLGNSLMAVAAMQTVDTGGGFNGLRAIGFTVTQALRVLSIFNVQMDTNKYLSEVKLATLFNNPDLMPSLKAYLAGLTPPLQLPDLTSYIAHVRTDHAVYTAIKNWSGV